MIYIILTFSFIIIYIIVKNLNKKNPPIKKKTLNNNENFDLLDLDMNLKVLKEKVRLQEVVNSKWDNQFNTLIKLREKAVQYDKQKKFSKAIEYHLKALNFGEHADLMNLNNYCHDINRLIILYGKNNQKIEQKLFLERMIEKYPESSSGNDWKVRLSKLYNKESQFDKINPSVIKQPTSGKIRVIDNVNRIKQLFPEFNFYYDLPLGINTLNYLGINNIVPKKLIKKYFETLIPFNELLDSAKLHESQLNYKEAIEDYLKMIVEGYERKEPYERLIIIFKKLNWINQEKEMLLNSISFFENLRETQKEYVLNLAKKYNMESKALEYINSNSKIYYFGGSFVLYDPFPIIKKWKTRLEKLNKQIDLGTSEQEKLY